MDISELYSIYQSHPVITTDSRDCPPGSIFFALRGDNFDGNKFAAAALEKGCAYAVVDNKDYAAGSRFILVSDTLAAFKQLARRHRRQFSIPVIAITGTNGKTTTKELIAAVLSERLNVLYTEGNFNNDVGVPKTLFRINSSHQVAVIEMGASHPGDIKTLAETAEPTCGLITNVGMAHLQGFGSLEGVARTKGELYDYLRGKPGAEVFVDADSPILAGMAGGLSTVWYGCDGGKHPQVEGRIDGCSPYVEFSWRADGDTWHSVTTHLIGSYNLANLLAAVAVGLRFGVTPQQICRALSGYTPHNSRSQFAETPYNKLIVDTYNANPTSMMAALENFRDMKAGRKMAILGDMRELGHASAAEHQKIANFLPSAGIDDIWLVGSEFGRTDSPCRKFADADEVKAEIARRRPEGFHILIKGSNGIKLFQLPGLL